MQVYREKLGLLKKAGSVVRTRLPRLGTNKKQEIIRLLYEISKREKKRPESVLRGFDSSDFGKIKHYLLKRRFPYAYTHNELSKPYLSKLKLDPSSLLNIQKTEFYPKKIFIEKSAWRSNLADRFKTFFPKADLKEIRSLKDYLKTNRRLKIKDYNKRSDTVFITYENHDFFKKCPCTKKALGCGYHIFNLSFGCIFECTYCYLQEYVNTPGLIFPANIDSFFRVFPSYKRPRMRIGTGEFSDSLMLDHITEYSLPIVEFFKNHKEAAFEFKTKSANIKNLLKLDHSGNIVVAWSLNPPKMIDENEFYASGLDERLSSARQCVRAGYKVAFHFDPVLYFEGWEKEYEKVIDLAFASVKPADIAWISIGTLRFNPNVKGIIEMRFPGNTILDNELVPGFDNKLRYPYGIRREIYQKLLDIFSKHSKKLTVYLCMEDYSMWQIFKKYLAMPSQSASLF